MEGADGYTTNAAVWTFTAISLTLVILRLICRLHLTSFSGLDDVFIVLSLVFTLLLSILTSVAVTKGYGTPASSLSPEQFTDAEKWTTILRCVSSLTLAVPKLSFAALLVRVFSPSKIVRWILYGMAGLGIVIAIITTLLWALRCNPVAASWDHSIQGQCLSVGVVFQFSLFQFAQSVVWDFAYAIYPMTVLARLQISRSRKVVLCGSMGLGIIAGIVGIYKCVTLTQLGAREATDPTIYDPIGTIWISVEGNLLIFAACIPTLGPLVQRVRQLTKTPNTTGNRAGLSSYATFASHSKPQDRYARFDDETRAVYGSDMYKGAGAGDIELQQGHRSDRRLDGHLETP